MKRAFFYFMSIAAFFLVQSTTAQIEQHQANFIYGFARLVEWPSLEKQLSFRIGVLGDNHQIIPHLRKICRGQSIQDKKIEIVVYESVDQLSACHILFVPNNRIGSLRKASRFLLGVPVLIVTESQESMPYLSIINMWVEDNMLGYQINTDRAKEAGLILSKQIIDKSRK